MDGVSDMRVQFLNEFFDSVIQLGDCWTLKGTMNVLSLIYLYSFMTAPHGYLNFSVSIVYPLFTIVGVFDV